MRPALASALVIVGSSAPAHAGSWRGTAEIATELDSNVNRAEQGGEAEPESAAVMRVSGDVEGAGRDWARWSVRAGSELRAVADPDVAGENVAVLRGDARADRPLPDRPVRVGLRGGAYDVLGLGDDAARAFRWLAADAIVSLDHAEHRASLSVGARDFTYKPEPRLDWLGPTLALAVSSEAWRGDDAAAELAPTSLEVVGTYRLELRGYDSLAYTAGCAPGDPDRDTCVAVTDERRSDLHHRFAAGVTFTGERVYAAEYELTINDSSSFRESWLRHRGTVAATAALPAGLLATARASVQIDRYPDGLVIPDDSQAQSVTSIDDDNRSSVSVMLARRLGPSWTAEARWAYWTDALASDTLPFERHVVALGLTWASTR